MALSGTIGGTTSNQYISAKLVWEARQSVSGNYSDVTATLMYSRTNTGYTTDGTWSGGITINGVRTPGTKSISISHNSNTVAMSVTTRVSHNNNGTKVVTLKADGSISGTSLSSTNLSDYVTLDTIPRLSNPTLSATSVNFGSQITIYTNRKSTNFTHRLYYKYGSSGWIEITSTASVTDSYIWTVPNDLMKQIPNATSLTITVSCDTYYNGSMLGYSTVDFTATVPTNEDTGTYPTIGGISWTKTSTEPSNWPITQGVSKGVLKMTGVTAPYGSTISTYSLTFAGLSSTSSSLEVSNIASSGTLTAIAKVTDSRGRTTIKSVDFSVSAYTPPQVVVSELHRCDAGGSEDASGDYFWVDAGVNYTQIGSNSITEFYIQYKKSSDTTYTKKSLKELLEMSPGLLFPANSNYSWDWIITASDAVSTVSVNGSIPTGDVVLDILYNGKGLGIGKVAEKEGLDSAWPFMLNGVDQTPVKQADYVIEQVIVPGGWIYRKWDSGIAECWFSTWVANATINTAWGSVYESAGYYAKFPEGLFAYPPIVSLSVPTATGGVMSLATMGETTKDRTCTFFAIRPDPTTLSFAVNIIAKGRWK
jgi:hypothetical protein